MRRKGKKKKKIKAGGGDFGSCMKLKITNSLQKGDLLR